MPLVLRRGRRLIAWRCRGFLLTPEFHLFRHHGSNGFSRVLGRWLAWSVSAVLSICVHRISILRMIFAVRGRFILHPGRTARWPASWTGRRRLGLQRWLIIGFFAHKMEQDTGYRRLTNSAPAAQTSQ